MRKDKLADVFSNRDKLEPIKYNSKSVCKDKVKLIKIRMCVEI